MILHTLSSSPVRILSSPWFIIRGSRKWSDKTGPFRNNRFHLRSSNPSARSHRNRTKKKSALHSCGIRFSEIAPKVVHATTFKNALQPNYMVLRYYAILCRQRHCICDLRLESIDTCSRLHIQCIQTQCRKCAQNMGFLYPVLV